MSSQQAELRPGCSVVRMTVRFIDRVDSIAEQCTVPSTILSLWMDKVTALTPRLACCTATLDQTMARDLAGATMLRWVSMKRSPGVL